MTSSPVSPSATGSPVARRRRPGPSRRAAGRSAPARRPVERRGAGDDGGLGRAVGVPHLAALDGQPVGQLGRARLAAEDQQPDLVQRLGRPQRGQRRHGGHDGDPLRRPATARGRCRCAPARAAPAPGRRRAARPATSPRTRRRTRPTGRPAPGRRARAARRLQEQPGLGVDEGGRRAVGDRDALGRAGRARGEDDPRVVVRGRGGRGAPTGAPCSGSIGPSSPSTAHTPASPNTSAARSSRVVGVDRHVGRAGREHGEDRDVQVGGAGGDPHPDPVADADAGRGQARRSASTSSASPR